MNEKQGLVIEKSRFVYEEKSDHYQLLALSLHKVCNVMTFYKKVTSEQYSADRKMLIETMIAQIVKVCLSRFESDC